MPAYVIADIEVTDADLYEQYKPLAAPTVEKYGGRYVVRGGEVQVKEGDWAPRRLVMAEFPDRAAAEAWYASPEYAEPLKMRIASTKSRLMIVDGV